MSIGKLTLIFVALMVSEPIFPLWSDSTPAQSGAPNPAASTQKPSPSAEKPSDDDDDDQPGTTGTRRFPVAEGRSSFGLLDSQSSYGKDFFPDTFIGPEFDRDTQLELEYVHGQKQRVQSNEGGVEFEWNFLWQFTLAGEFGYDSEHEQTARVRGMESQDVAGESANGFESVDLALYHPILQFVTKDDLLDYTAVARFDVGIPTRTAASGNDVQLIPYLGQLLRLGEHVSLEAWTGPQFTLAPHQTNRLIYGALGGYKITRSQIALPFTKSVTPLLELDGQSPFSNGGRAALFGVAGFNWQAQAIGKLHLRVNLGYQFAVDRGARDEIHWGIVSGIFSDF